MFIGGSAAAEVSPRCLAVGSHADLAHEHVGNADDAGGQQDVASPQAQGTAAVPPLSELPDRVDRRSLEGDPVEDVGADHLGVRDKGLLLGRYSENRASRSH